ncbi:hypothetical protein Tco_0037224, partial [Tanacetum coccineum]
MGVGRWCSAPGDGCVGDGYVGDGCVSDGCIGAAVICSGVGEGASEGECVGECSGEGEGEDVILEGEVEDNSSGNITTKLLPSSLLWAKAMKNRVDKKPPLRNNGVGKFSEQCVGKASHAQTRGVPIPVTAPESGPSTALKMTVPSTTEEKICKKNDVKARSLLLMALPNEHQLTFNQYVDAQSMFAA